MMNGKNGRWILVLLVAVGILSVSSFVETAEEDWPREIIVPEGKIIIYQPQVETFRDDKLTARAAVSVKKEGTTEPVFGVVWFSARISTDRNIRTIKVLDVDVTDVRAPDQPDPAKVERFSGILEEVIPKWDLTISLDRVLAMLDLVEKEKGSGDDFQTTPPKIIFVTHPAVLVPIDGEPEMQKVEDSVLMRVVNTPFFIVFDPAGKIYYLRGGNEWFSSPDIIGPWQSEKKPPASVRAAISKEPGAAQTDQYQAESLTGRMPQIIVTTEPAELIVSDGEAKYQSITGTGLLYISNTKSDVFMEIGTQRYFVLLSGRWFAASSTDGPWAYVPSDKLPPDFKKIPSGSAKARVLASVTGTEEAKDAVLDTYIPQTSAVKRGEEKVVVSYDGDPKFEKIEDTVMYYAVNTPQSVIRINNKYYLCHEAVWYESGYASGPWIVSVSVPKVIYTIPPSYPVYHVKYVYVYDYTPDVVYVGYTSGYVGGYVYGGTVIYGTGYYYRPWYGRVYYVRPATWGVAVRYNSYTGGWGVRVGYGGPVGWVGVGRVGWAGGAAWRYGGYYGDVHADRTVTTPRGTWSGDIDIDRDYGDIDIDRDVKFEPNENVYKRREEAKGRREERPADREARRAQTEKAGTRYDSRRSSQPNNVIADRNGNVYRRTDTGWQQRDRSGWSRPDASSRTSVSRSSFERSRSSLNSQYTARQRGAQRSSSFNKYRGTGSRRGGGISRGGGRGRR